MKKEKGITLIILIIVIIILIILAGITIGALSGDNGIVKKVVESKEKNEIANEKEIVEKSATNAMGNNKYGNIEENELKKQLDMETGEGKTTVINEEKEYEIIFNETNRYYTIDSDGNISEPQEIVKDNNPGDITKGIDGEDLDGSEEHPYEIWCIEDLVVLSNITNGTGIRFENGNIVEVKHPDSLNNKYIKLKRNLNFKSKLSYSNSDRIDFGDINKNEEDGNALINEMTTGEGFTPIKNFGGMLDGNNKRISNLYINSSSEYNTIGLISFSNNKIIICDLELTGDIYGKWDAGGFIGNCANKEYSEIRNCINKVNVNGGNHVGGFVGISSNGLKMQNVINYGKIKITNGNYGNAGCGGIIGTGVKEIKNAVNYGEISGNKPCAGIVGTQSLDGQIVNCYNRGKIDSNGDNAAGILSYFRSSADTKIINCYNIADINSNKTSGGIVATVGGVAWDTKEIIYIYNSFNTGNIIGKDYASGLVGIQSYICSQNYITLKNCWNIGNVEANVSTGILAKRYTDSRTDTKLILENVYYTNNIGISNGITYEGNANFKNKNEILTYEFVQILNEYKDENNEYPSEWKKWKLGENNYPTFE